MRMVVSSWYNAVITWVHIEKALNDVILIEPSMTKGACSSYCSQKFSGECTVMLQTSRTPQAYRLSQ